ncbi:hypothetical protein [Bradyrhizobium forestalis]|nr:hypothetical protein [Bradyrhizobium forestalis]
MKDYVRRWWQRWWNGEYVPPKNVPGIPVIFIQGRSERHWTSKLLHTVVEFYLEHWQWCFTTAFTVTGLVIAAWKLP